MIPDNEIKEFRKEIGNLKINVDYTTDGYTIGLFYTEGGYRTVAWGLTYQQTISYIRRYRAWVACENCLSGSCIERNCRYLPYTKTRE